MLVFIQAPIPALHLKSKHCSTKNLKRGSETTALTSTNPGSESADSWAQRTAQENNFTFNSTTVKTGARCLSSKYESPFFTLLPKGRKPARIRSPSFRQFYPFEQDTTGSPCVRIYLSHSSLLHIELLFIINHTYVRCYGIRTV